MSAVRLTISELRFRRALERAGTEGLLPTPNEVLVIADGEVRAIVTLILDLMLEPELAWLEERNLGCSIRATADSRTFEFVFVDEGDARRFHEEWGGTGLSLNRRNPIRHPFH